MGSEDVRALSKADLASLLAGLGVAPRAFAGLDRWERVALLKRTREARGVRPPPSPSAAAAAASRARSPAPAAAPAARRPSSPTPRRAQAGAAAEDDAALVASPPPHFEFGGPVAGPLGIVLGLPLLTFLFGAYCTDAGWPNIELASVWADPAAFARRVASDAAQSWKLEVFLAFTAYMLVLVLLSLVVPGPVHLGAPLADGSRLPYRLNGFRCLVITVAAALAVQYYEPFGERRYTLLWILDHYTDLTTASIAFSALLSLFLYAYSFVAGTPSNGRKLLAAGGHTGWPLYDFFIGRELNPRVLFGQLDLKFFCELRPGLTLWMLINLAAGLKQASLPDNKTGLVDPWLATVIALEGLYIVDSVWNEAAILTTMDITTDGFGFMLAFGDLAWVPAVYSLQARFLSARYSPIKTPRDAVALATILALAAAGMYIFRGANSQKDDFKRDPAGAGVRGLATIATPQGGKLLAGGWWGVARHVNYFGDWLMAVAWSLPTGLATPLTYFYPLYFAVLLVHRDMRDDEKCAKKYGKAWAKYCKAVPYRIVPGLY